MWAVSRNWSALGAIVVDERNEFTVEYHFCLHLSPVADSRVLAGSGASARKIYIEKYPKNPKFVY